MAILTRPIANWLYELDSHWLDESSQVGSIYVKYLLEVLQQCTTVFVQNGIFVPTEARISATWISFIGGEMRAFERKPLFLDVCHASVQQLSDMIMSEIVSCQPEEGFTRPESVEIRGVTHFLHRNDSQHSEAGTISIAALFAGVREIDIRVYGDRWLPYSLDGKICNGDYEINAVRLENAMKEIEKILAVEVIWDDHSDYCNISPYRLQNFVEEDGQVVGVDELGRMIPGS